MNERAIQAVETLFSKTGKDFVSISDLKKKGNETGAILAEELGLKKITTNNFTSGKLLGLLGSGFKELKKANSKCLAKNYTNEEFVTSAIARTPNNTPSNISKVLPFKKEVFIATLNELFAAGRIVAELDANYKVRQLSLPAGVAIETAKVVSTPEPEHKQISISNPSKAVFRAAFEKLENRRMFVPITELRRELGWPREVFDEMLRKLRDEGIIELHIANQSEMSAEEWADTFVDENGYHMRRVIWHGKC